MKNFNRILFIFLIFFSSLNFANASGQIAFIDIDYIIKNSLKKPEHKKYITDRKLLRKLKNNTCWENYILIRDSLDNGDKCEIEIKLQETKDLIKPLSKKSSVNDDNVINLLNYYELVNELKTIHG